MLTIMKDGHFGLQRFAKVDDPDDVFLLVGAGFFPVDEEYSNYVCTTAMTADEEFFSPNVFRLVIYIKYCPEIHML